MAEKPINLPALALVALSALSSCKDAPKPQEDKKGPSVEAMAQLDIRDRLDEVARLDLSDGSDDFDENSLHQRNNRFLQTLIGKDPSLKRNFLLRLRAILQARPQAKTPQDAQDDFGFMDLEKLYQWLQQRDAVVQADGTVHFPTKEAEARTTLADLTQDDEIEFEATPQTLEKMGIEASAPFTATRLQDDMEVYVKGKKIKAKKGAFVVSVTFETTGEDGKPKTTRIPYKVFVFNGDRIIDSLNKDMGDQPDKAAGQSKKAPQDFETFLQIKIPTFSLPKARALFHTHKPNYEKIFTEEYPELLASDGMSFDKHFVYFVQWALENRVPLSDDSIRVFLDALSGRRQKDQVSDQPESKIDKIVQQAEGSLRGEKDLDEHILSYQDSRRRANAEAAEIAIRNHGPLFAIIRQAGSFFDPYTYNRLINNYSSKVSVAAVGGNEYLMIDDITPFTNNPATPKHIKERITPGTFATRLNSTTTYNQSSDAQLREALAFSAKTIERRNVGPENFQVQYDDRGLVTGVFLQNEPYNPSTFIAPPNALKNLPNNVAKIEFGGITRTINLQDYFARYRALEAQNAGRSQQIILYDEKSRMVSKSRNPGWFVEGGDEFYRGIAEEITSGGNTDVEKILMIGRFLQTKLHYIKELAEVNKLTLGTFMDGGGDCEDSYTAYKTLANAIGLGNLVGGVLFDEHVATIIKGRHGGTMYQIDGAMWTIMETATNGQAVAPGLTDHDNPQAFILPNGQVVAAQGSGLTILQLTTEDQLNQVLVQNFDTKRQTVEKFITDPKNQPKEENLREGSNVADELDPFTEALINAYGDIAKTGFVAETVSDRYSEILRKASKFLEDWAQFHQKQDDEEKTKELGQHPEKVKESLIKFRDAYQKFVENIEPATKQIVALTVSYKDRQNDLQAMVELADRIVEIANKAELIPNLRAMEKEYDETLDVAPSISADLKAKMKRSIDAGFEAINLGINDGKEQSFGIQRCLNMVNAIIERLQGR